MKENGKHIIQVFKKYFDRNASRLELRELEKATTEDDYIREAKEGIDQLNAVDRRTSKANLENRLAKRTNKKQNRVAPMQWLKLAAGVAILLSIGLFIWRPISNTDISSKDSAPVQELNDIEAPSNQVNEDDTVIRDEKTNNNEHSNANDEESSSIVEVERVSDLTKILPKKEAASIQQAAKKKEDIEFSISVYNQGSISEDLSASDFIDNSDDLAKSDQKETTLKSTVDNNIAIDGVAIQSDRIVVKDDNQENTKTEAPIASSAKSENIAELPEMAQAKAKRALDNNRQIQGIITDDEGEPLIGVSIVEKGTRNGTITNIDGEYNLELTDDSDALVISYTGFESQEVYLGDENQVDITLDQGAELSEVVIVGYGQGTPDDINQNSYPDYPVDGNVAFKKYIEANLIFPQAAQDANIKGKVTLLFDVNANGRPTDIEVKKSLGYGCDEEAIRLLEEGPDWKKGNRASKTKLVVRFR